MAAVDYLLIGGGLAALHAAKQIRRVDQEGTILLVSDEPLPPYDRPPLSKEFLLGKKTREQLIYDAEEALAEQRIELALGRAVQRLDLTSHTATIAGGAEVRFRKALLATGGRPVQLRLPGAELAGIHYLRTVADAEAIGQAAERGGDAVIVGG